MKVKIISVDKINRTGMLHLCSEFAEDEIENNSEFKTSHLNEIVEVEPKHWCGKTKVYYCKSLHEWFSQHELKVIK